MSVYLRRLGYSTTTANTIAKARDHLKRHAGRFAAVVLDAGMADEGLDELALGLLEADANLRLVISSGYPVEMGILRSAAPGRVEFLHKPFSPEMLVGALRRMLGPEEKEV